MARLSGPKCRLCRREGTKLYLKGTRCETEKCSLSRKPYKAGQHGPKKSGTSSQYGLQLREKQKLKRIYSILEKQFGNYVSKALNSKGVSSENLMQMLESRLDNIVYRCGFAVSRAQARQLIRRNLFKVNGQIVNIPSRLVRAGDHVSPVSFEKLELKEGYIIPEWLIPNVKERYVKIDRLPVGEEIKEPVNAQLIVEFYSR
jgi:small subunit ribosomal protein S4